MSTTTSAIGRVELRSALRRAADHARLAPSIHNTQPWRFTAGDDWLRIDADPSRRLGVLDPTGRQLLVSCGCAVLNARVSLARDGWQAQVERTVDRTPGSGAGATDAVALLHAVPRTVPSDPDVQRLALLADVVSLRQTNRRRFGDEPVPDEVLEVLETAAGQEGARLVQVRHDDHRLAVARLAQQADSIELQNPAYRAELRSWTARRPERRDGVPARVVPHVGAQTDDEVPIRDFDSSGEGWLPSDTRSSRNQCLLLLCTDGDDAPSWERAGEALERIWLECTFARLAVSVFSQLAEVPSARARLRAELGLTGWPHLLLRVGRAPAAPSTPRRHLDEVFVQQRPQPATGASRG